MGSMAVNPPVFIPLPSMFCVCISSRSLLTLTGRILNDYDDDAYSMSLAAYV